MKNSKFEKAYLNGYSNKGDLMKIATYIGNNYITSSDQGEKPSKEALDSIIESMAIDMSTGAEITKNGYLLKGALLGIVGTIIALQIKKRLKRKA